ncbi:MAG: hypothetical protein QF755_00345 [Candidatus Peribacteraceae bacterium]|jgi:hypothetical protein|nr:hypothetical protein [Candidatus Peribacteraceae bacterium]|tara:strand:+ start:505 stop:1200 length:696 start_codon:yes stop_codon:yes gene_type:complete
MAIERKKRRETLGISGTVAGLKVLTIMWYYGWTVGKKNWFGLEVERVDDDLELAKRLAACGTDDSLWAAIVPENWPKFEIQGMLDSLRGKRKRAKRWLSFPKRELRIGHRFWENGKEPNWRSLNPVLFKSKTCPMLMHSLLSIDRYSSYQMLFDLAEYVLFPQGTPIIFRCWDTKGAFPIEDEWSELETIGENDDSRTYKVVLPTSSVAKLFYDLTFTSGMLITHEMRKES